jgi:predicted acylesterase/phospholipase RssA
MDVREARAWAHTQADKACDIVMEGGAASGIVYPRAICELSRSYRFQRIGGASAGAVAAAATAAAECGRRKAEQDPRQGNPKSFDQLSEVPGWFSERVDGHTRLRRLFEPEPKMRPAYELFMALISGSGVLRSIGPVVFAAARFFPASFFGGALIGLVLAALAVYGALQVGGGAGLLLGLAAVAAGILATVVLAVLFVLASLAMDVVCRLPRHHFGVARGYSKDPGKDRSPRVTNWMYGLLQELAGKPMKEPLTFGDLERCPDAVVGNTDGIMLRLMTTCLTRGRPYRLPFADDEVFYYDAAELALFFPPEIMTWMKGRPNPGARPVEGYHALPQARDFPVVVAARMSMAFPLFFSSIPLYAFDETRFPETKDRSQVREGLKEPERCWFADGGICSNLPVHFFDLALPRWPTFALDLRKFHRDLEPGKNESEDKKVWIDHDFRDESGASIITEWWTRLEHERPQVDEALGFRASFARTASFLGVVLDTMMDWNDNAQLRPVGSRDRVAHVSLGDKEGSFNVSMDPDQILALAKRGGYGGQKLRDRFANDTGWRDNRSARLFSFLIVTGEYLQRVKRACDYRGEGGKRYYVDDLSDAAFHPPGCTPLTSEQSLSAQALLKLVLDAAADVPPEDAPESLAAIVPPPRQTIRFLPEGEPIPARSSSDDQRLYAAAASQRGPFAS